MKIDDIIAELEKKYAGREYSHEMQVNLYLVDKLRWVDLKHDFKQKLIFFGKSEREKAAEITIKFQDQTDNKATKLLIFEIAEAIRNQK